MRRVVADLHVHTALSPCASREMTPGDIVREAVRKGLDMIAICDHNSSGNVRAVQAAASGELAVIAGLEVTTVEEVHVVALFPDAERAGRVSELILAGLPLADSRATPGGEQLLFGLDGEPSGLERRMLVAATALDLAAAVDLIRSHGAPPSRPTWTAPPSASLGSSASCRPTCASTGPRSPRPGCCGGGSPGWSAWGSRS